MTSLRSGSFHYSGISRPESVGRKQQECYAGLSDEVESSAGVRGAVQPFTAHDRPSLWPSEALASFIVIAFLSLLEDSRVSQWRRFLDSCVGRQGFTHFCAGRIGEVESPSRRLVRPDVPK